MKFCPTEGEIPIEPSVIHLSDHTASPLAITQDNYK